MMGPNLTVHDLQAPQVVGFGGFRIEADVCNVGDTFTPNTDVLAVISIDTLVDNTDPVAGTAFVNGLAPGQCERISIDGVSAFGNGTFTLGVLVDPFDTILEFDELDNAATQPIGFGPDPDLFAQALSAPPSANGAFVVTVTVCNQGVSFAPGVTVDVYASTDNVIEPPQLFPTSPDVLLGSELAFVGPESCEQVNVSAGTPPLPNGAYFVGTAIDVGNAVIEVFEDNNIATFGVIGFGFGPDLIVSGLDAPPSADTPFDATVTVCNQGTDFAGPADLSIYASADTTIDTSPSGDVILTTAPVPPLSAGQCSPVVVSLFPPPGPPGPSFLGAVVDLSNAVPELIETNNTGVFGPYGFGPGSDLTVTAIETPPSADTPFDTTVTVCNQGTQPSGGNSVSIIASTDTTIESSIVNPFTLDIPLGSALVPGLAPGQCTQIVVNT
ncbi:MAG: CARDB domain-containing protein, partial [Myxococcota bacterium]